ncbi:hypothetical protein OC835_004572 [Tilletia horrida]|nr:hypothetical protein OC835_004572 [Tilletia horrida]
MSVTSRAHATRLTTPRRAWPKTRARTPLPDDLPLFQVSVPAEITLALGRALRSLHDRGIGIMLGGQPVHGPDVATAHLRSRLPEPQMGLSDPHFKYKQVLAGIRASYADEQVKEDTAIVDGGKV